MFVPDNFVIIGHGKSTVSCNMGPTLLLYLHIDEDWQ